MVYAGDSKSPGGNPVRVRLSPRAYAVLIHTVLVTAARAQQRPLTGTVVSATSGEALPFSIVALVPGFAQHFTDQAGHFVFSGVPPGRYHLVVRQIGYYPLDTAIVLGADTTPNVRIALRHLAIQLPPVTVTAPQACVAPGPPDSTVTPQLTAVFGQVLENARRLQLLNESFPYDYGLERRTWTVDRTGRQELLHLDTLTHETEEGWRYKPGQLMAWRPGPSGRELFIRLPTLVDFADSAFVSAHCFWLAGPDSLGADTLIRLDFAPAASLRTTDVAGAAYLDPGTYQMRYTVVQLTRPARAIRGVTSLVATSHFREVAPGIPLQDHVRAVTTLAPGAAYAPVQRVEEQWLVWVNFRRSLLR